MIGILSFLVIAVFIASFFLDSFVRARVEARMNEKLIGYHTRLPRAHVQLLDLSLTLSGLTIVQDAHPSPPVADISELAFRIQWGELILGHVVADVLLTHPNLQINLTQLKSEHADKVPLSHKGWQDALQAAYPFKINRFRIRDGEVTYVDTDPRRPLHLTEILFHADNIRNIHSPDQVYPSPFHATAVLFDHGQLTLDGKANFLDEPFPGSLSKFSVEKMPLSQFEPELTRENLHVYQGVLSGNGVIEYAPKIRKVDVQQATIDGIHLDYVHTSQSAAGETQRLNTAKQAAADVNNAPGLVLRVREVQLVHSEFKFLDDASNPHFRFVITDMNAKAKNISNHLSDGPAELAFNGKFMGSGDTKFTGVLRPEHQGPDFDFDLAIQNTDLTSLNDLLLAYGKFDVASGKASVFSQITMKNHYVTGYVKPLFSDITVYDSKKDAKKPILHQAYEVVIGGAAKLFKNRSTQQVATKVDISGPVNTPNISTWDAILQLLENAFIKAIIPGYDREIAQARQPH